MTPRTRFAVLLAPTLSLVLWAGLPAQGQEEKTLRQIQRATPKGAQIRRVSPPAGGSSESTPLLERAPSGRGPEDFERQVDAMAQIQAQLGGAFNEFEREHQRALTVARRVLRDYERCHRRIFEEGRYTDAQRNAACSPSDPEDRCLWKLVERCIGDDITEYQESRLALAEKSQEISGLLRPYGERSIAELR